MLLTEYGLIEKIKLDFKNKKYTKNSMSNYKVYNDLEEYINDNSKVDQIILKNIIYLFAFFAAINLINIFFVFYHHLTVFLPKYIEKKFGHFIFSRKICMKKFMFKKFFNFFCESQMRSCLYKIII